MYVNQLPLCLGYSNYSKNWDCCYYFYYLSKEVVEQMANHSLNWLLNKLHASYHGWSFKIKLWIQRKLFNNCWLSC